MEHWGRLYIHEDVVREAASSLGWSDSASAERRASQSLFEKQEALRELTETRQQVTILKQALALVAGEEAVQSVAEVSCRWCGAIESNKGRRFYDNPASKRQHERFCLSNPDRALSLQENWDNKKVGAE